MTSLAPTAKPPKPDRQVSERFSDSAEVSASSPRLRDDLEITRMETPSGIVYQVRDGEEGRFYRFKEIEHEILRQFDGSKSLEEIRRRIEGQYDAALPIETIQAFEARLREFHLLESENETPKKRRRIRGSLLYLRVPLINPDRILGWLDRRLGVLFTRGSVVLSLFLLMSALAVAVSEAGEIGRCLAGLLQFKNLVPAMIVTFLVTALHEFSHGLSCKHFGGEVREIGFLLIYFHPAFYCDVSSAWQFPEKHKRLVGHVRRGLVRTGLLVPGRVVLASHADGHLGSSRGIDRRRQFRHQESVQPEPADPARRLLPAQRCPGNPQPPAAFLSISRPAAQATDRTKDGKDRKDRRSIPAEPAGVSALRRFGGRVFLRLARFADR